MMAGIVSLVTTIIRMIGLVVLIGIVVTNMPEIIDLIFSLFDE